jgi:hypothetical protein
MKTITYVSKAYKYELKMKIISHLVSSANNHTATIYLRTKKSYNDKDNQLAYLHHLKTPKKSRIKTRTVIPAKTATV